jgi:hypothetical protein
MLMLMHHPRLTILASSWHLATAVFSGSQEQCALRACLPVRMFAVRSSFACSLGFLFQLNFRFAQIAELMSARWGRSPCQPGVVRGNDTPVLLRYLIRMCTCRTMYLPAAWLLPLFHRLTSSTRRGMNTRASLMSLRQPSNFRSCGMAPLTEANSTGGSSPIDARSHY